MTTGPDSAHALDGETPSWLCIGHKVLGAGEAGRLA